jgi:hypothetical protein
VKLCIICVLGDGVETFLWEWFLNTSCRWFWMAPSVVLSSLETDVGISSLGAQYTSFNSGTRNLFIQNRREKGRNHHHHRQNSPFFLAIAFLRRFWKIASGLHFFGFRDNNFYTEQGPKPCVQPPTWRTRSLYLCRPVTGWSSYTPRHRVPFPSPSTSRRATVEVF